MVTNLQTWPPLALILLLIIDEVVETVTTVRVVQIEALVEIIAHLSPRTDSMFSRGGLLQIIVLRERIVAVSQRRVRRRSRREGTSTRN